MGAKFRQPPFSVAEANIISKSITANGTYNAASDNADGYNPVTVNVPESVIVSKSITANGTYNASSDSADGYNPVTVNVPPDIQTPAYQDFSYAYLATNGGFYSNNTGKKNYLNVWEVEAGIYLIALGAEVGNRNRCGRKAGYTYNDIEQYLLNSEPNDKIFDVDYIQA